METQTKKRIRISEYKSCSLNPNLHVESDPNIYHTVKLQHSSWLYSAFHITLNLAVGRPAFQLHLFHREL